MALRPLSKKQLILQKFAPANQTKLLLLFAVLIHLSQLIPFVVTLIVSDPFLLSPTTTSQSTKIIRRATGCWLERIG